MLTIGYVLVRDVIGGVQIGGLGKGLQLRPGCVKANVCHRAVWLALHHPVLRRAHLHT